jgi:hypothetical protein
MDRKEQLKDCHSKIMDFMDTSVMLGWYRECLGVSSDFSDTLSLKFNELETVCHKYFELIHEPSLQQIALSRLGKDIDSIIERFRTDLRFYLSLEGYELTMQEMDEICFISEGWFNDISYQLIEKELVELEFNLIGAIQKKRKTKQELSLTQKQINLLFHSLRENKVITDKVTDVARGLSTMTGLGYNFYNQNLSNPLSETKDSIPTDADFVKAINSLKKSIDYLIALKVKNGIK